MKKALLALSLLLCSLPAFADVEGTYIFKGYDPRLKVKYDGVATIKKGENGVYQAEWTHGERKFVGTGILTGDILSFITSGPTMGAAFGEEKKNITYLNVYKVQGNLLKGTWVSLGETIIGTEDMEKKPE